MTTSTTTEHPVEIDVKKFVYAVTFSADGKYLVSGELGEVQVWQVEDGKRLATMNTGRGASCVAVSADSRWIAAGTYGGEVFVWDAETRQQVFSSHEEDFLSAIHTVDVSPDSSQFVTGSSVGVASVWDIATRKRVWLLRYYGQVIVAAKYAPQGDRIVIATRDRVRIYDNLNHHLLVDINVNVTSLFNGGVLWFSNHFLVISDGTIKRFEASTGSAVSEWLAPDTSGTSCIALPKHGKIIAYSTKSTVTFWDTSRYTQLSLIQHPQDIRSISFSPDDRHLAIGGQSGKIIIHRLSHTDVAAVAA